MQEPGWFFLPGFSMEEEKNQRSFCPCHGHVRHPPFLFDFSLRHRLHDNSATLDKDMVQRVFIMNPMNFISENATSVAPHWFIRHGAKDRDTSFLVPINLATKLKKFRL